MRFLVTRPQPECGRTAWKIRALGHEADEMPLLEQTVTIPDRLDLQAISALAVTSARIAPILAGHNQFPALRTLSVYAVGDRTANALRQAGWPHVISAAGAVDDLVDLIAGRHRDGSILYVAAGDRAGDLEKALSDRDIECHVCEAYRMIKLTRLDDAIEKRLQMGAYAGILVFSRRTAEAFADIVRSFKWRARVSNLPVYAISSQAGEPLRGMANLEVADEPTEDAVLRAALSIP